MDVIDEVEEDKQTLIILTGNIGCGKTTVTDWLLGEYEGRKIVAISNDAITMMTGNGNYSRYQVSLFDMYKDMFFKCVCSAIDAGATIVCDNSHMSKRSRAKLIALAKESGISVTSIDMGPGDPESLKRRQEADDNRDTSPAVWAMVHSKFASKYEPPSMAEGFDGVVTGDEIWEIMNEML